MKKVMSTLVAVGLALGAVSGFAQPPAQTDQPKAEKGGKSKTKKGGDKQGKRKAEEPKAQHKK